MGRLFAFLVAVFCITLPAGIGGADDGDAPLRMARRVEDLYANAGTFKARFRQTFVHRASGDKTVSEGRMAAADGSRLSFRYGSPAGDRVVADGDTAKLYQRADKTMYVLRLTRARHALAVAFLLGRVGLSKDFKLRLLDPKRGRVKRGSVLEAIPKQPNPMLARLILYIDPATAQVLRVMVIDAQGNTNRFDFHERKFGIDLPDGEFRFKPPAGTKIVSP